MSPRSSPSKLSSVFSVSRVSFSRVRSNHRKWRLPKPSNCKGRLLVSTIVVPPRVVMEAMRQLLRVRSICRVEASPSMVVSCMGER